MKLDFIIDHVAASIEESKNLPVFSFDDFMGSLQGHDVRLNRSIKNNSHKAFQVKEATTKYSKTMVRQAKVQEEEDSVVVEVVAIEEAEEGTMGIGCPMSKVTQRIAFNVIITNPMDI